MIQLPHSALNHIGSTIEQRCRQTSFLVLSFLDLSYIQLLSCFWYSWRR